MTLICLDLQKSWVQMGNWVLCHVLLNKRSRKSFEDDNWKILDSRVGLTQQDFARNDAIIDQDDATSCSSSSSCGSSVVTHEVSSSRKPLDHEETNNV